MNNQVQMIEEAEEKLVHTYNRFQIVLEEGRGVYLFDVNGKKYLDFAAGIAVCALGYDNREYQDALIKQIEKLVHTSNLYYNQPSIKAASRLVKASGMDRVFFTSSGTEAIEGALKAAKKYAFSRDHHAGHEIIAMQHSFHGRSLGALSVTGNEQYQTPFRPLLPGVLFASFNDIESVRSLVSERTCAIIMEPIQGEGGIFPADAEFLGQVRALCDEKDILLIFDEIQCGMGRTGEMFAWQYYNVRPDILISAKALGCGVPIGAFMITERVAKYSLGPGDHGTTYGGNPLCCAAANKVLEIMERDHMTSHTREIGDYLWNELEKVMEQHTFIIDHRGVGLIQGLEFDTSVKAADVTSKALDCGLILISAGSNVLRFVPPLIIKKEHVDEMIQKLKRVLAAF
ncbi:MAG: aspartate aminotransferase family protein [Lachnospiraceae bacterium]